MELGWRWFGLIVRHWGLLGKGDGDGENGRRLVEPVLP